VREVVGVGGTRWASESCKAWTKVNCSSSSPFLISLAWKCSPT